MGMELGVWDCIVFFILFVYLFYLFIFVVELDGLVSFFNLTNYVLGIRVWSGSGGNPALVFGAGLTPYVPDQA